MVISRHQNSGQSNNLMEANKSFQCVENIQYFAMTVLNQN